MKRLIILLILIFTVSLFGQTSDSLKSAKKPERRNELGMIIISLTDIKFDRYETSYHDFRYENGLCYKYKITNHFVFRNSVEWWFTKFNDMANNGFGDSNNNNDIIIKSGMEWRISKHKFVPFCAIDFSYWYNQCKGIGHYSGGGDPFYIPETFSFYNLKTNSIGIEPSIGIRYSPIKAISISIETSLIFYYSWQSDYHYNVFLNTTNYYSPNFGTKKSHYNDWSYNPIKFLTLTYNFGKKNVP